MLVLMPTTKTNKEIIQKYHCRILPLLGPMLELTPTTKTNELDIFREYHRKISELMEVLCLSQHPKPSKQ
jgi:hypothetical protein